MPNDFWADSRDDERDGDKLQCGPAERNRDPILEALRRMLPDPARVVEIGSGTGQHVAHFTSHWPTLTWQPTEMSPTALASIAAYRADTDAERFLPPMRLDVTEGALPDGPWDGVFSANVVHITPWRVCEAVVQKSAAALDSGGQLLLYGPFRFSGQFTAPSNADFDARLRARDPSFGVRDADDIFAVARAVGFLPPRVIDMPANNHVLTFELAR